jgi:acyl-CoA reductase-like NAD-dependent aldehyde dehydrogenase
MVKQSEYPPRFGALFTRLVRERFAGDLIMAVVGGVDAGARFAGMPFDHLLFTGSATARPRPLVLYVFDRDHRRVKRMLQATASGGAGAVGRGRCHGPEGFKTFSQFRSVFRQSRLGVVGWL